MHAFATGCLRACNLCSLRGANEREHNGIGIETQSVTCVCRVKEVPAAVSVRGLTLQYSSKAPPIIDKANLTVPKGAIYGLLGASGCGKTSLLKCLVGLQKPDSGTVLVFGEPLHKGLVPGPAVGFMPQYKRGQSAPLLHFHGPITPPTKYLFRLLRLEVTPCRPRLVQCSRRGRLDRVTSCCRGPSRCSRCGGGGHERASCSAAAPTALTVVGNAVDNPRCPRWQQERPVATALLQSTEEESRLAVRAKIRAEEAAKQPMIAPASTRQRSSYADAAKQLRILKEESMNAGKQVTQSAMGTTNAGQGVASTDVLGTTEVRDRREAALQALLTAVQATATTTQADAPAYHIAMAALAAQQALFNMPALPATPVAPQGPSQSVHQGQGPQ
ncbi:hypothetical protein HPB48_003430 [Haemaphysalis longicornis]|uniref:ABC transporter domain-containing protein n=1 Tax=Haemaphysalis longicornis TaxID=44386 RepID=A0A9J6GBH5_HAELO|nr:hypothetical protein HPB48_003430 [Haemaphysalis longicornis]